MHETRYMENRTLLEERRKLGPIQSCRHQNNLEEYGLKTYLKGQ